MKVKSLLPAIWLLASCAGIDNQAEPGLERIQVHFSQTRIGLKAGHSVWNKGDGLSVFFASSKNELWHYDGEEGAPSGNLVSSAGRNVEGADGPIYSVYPYNSSASLEESTISTFLPTDQSYRKDSFGVALLAARADKVTDGLTFLYASAMVRLRLTDCNVAVKSVLLEPLGGEKIAGNCTISFSDGGLTVSGGDSGRVAVIGPADIEGAADFIFSILPTDFSKGCRFTVTYADKEKQEIVYTTPFKVDAGEVETISAKGILNDDTIIRFTLNFSDGTTMQWPFCGKYNSGNYKFITGEVVGPWYLAVSPNEYPFYMFQASPDPYPFRITNGGGLRIGGTVGDFIRFPGIAGYRLASIALVTSYSASFKIVGPDGKDIPDTSISLEKEFGFLPLEGTGDGKAYDMVMTNTNNIGIYTMTLVYKHV